MIENINKIIWAISSVLLVSMGIYFSLKLKFVQVHFRSMFKSLTVKTTKGIKPYKTLLMVLAGRIGVGSIAGIALSIYLGGVGTIFWMWFISVVCASLSFGETILGIKYKEKDYGDIYKGGPSYYIKKGLGNKKLGGIYAILVIISYIFGFLGIQANTITKSVTEMVNISPVLIGIILSIITFFAIFNGIEKISNITSKIVPFMIILYVGTSIYICFKNIGDMPLIISKIFKEAFNFKAFFTSFIPMFIIGVQRGIFTNEAGLGTGAIASSTVESKDAKGQGYLQMLGVYITTMLVCTSTAFIILTSPYETINIKDINGIEITQFSFVHHLGIIGNIIIFISILLFSFSTILTGYYDGESSLKYFSNNIKKRYLILLKLITIAVLFIGCILPSNFIWSFVDIMVGMLAIINIYALYKLRHEIINTFKKK